MSLSRLRHEVRATGLERFVFYPGRPFRNVWDILAVLFLV